MGRDPEQPRVDKRPRGVGKPTGAEPVAPPPTKERRLRMHATEERTTTTEEAPRCRWGSATPEPCPRAATVAVWGDELDSCAEHAAIKKFGDEEAAWLDAEYMLGKFLRKARKRDKRRSPLVEILEGSLEEAGRRKEDNYRRLEGAVAVADSHKSKAHW